MGASSNPKTEKDAGVSNDAEMLIEPEEGNEGSSEENNGMNGLLV